MMHFRVLSLAALAAVLAAPLAAGAQQTPLPAPAGAAAPAHHHHHGGRFLHAVHALHLSPAQRERIAALAAQSRQANRNVDPATRRANRKQFRTQIEAILTPAQRTQLHTALQRQHRSAAPAR